jgi:hypothetical protein
MPVVSKKQGKFMRAVAHSPSFAKKVGVPMSVGREFTKSGGGMPVKPMSESKARSMDMDESKRKAVSGMKKGGMAKTNPFMEMVAKKKAMAGKPAKKMASGGMTSMGKVKTAAPSRDGVATKGKTKGTMVKMAGSTGMKKGGMTKMKSGGRTC